jgi:hypothetical protein
MLIRVGITIRLEGQSVAFYTPYAVKSHVHICAENVEYEYKTAISAVLILSEETPRFHFLYNFIHGWPVLGVFFQAAPY